MKLLELKSYELDDKMIKEIFFNIKKIMILLIM